MKTINNIQNKGIKVLALRNLNDYFSKNEFNRKDIEQWRDTELDGCFSFQKAIEPYELNTTEKVDFWHLVNESKESEAEKMILNKY